MNANHSRGSKFCASLVPVVALLAMTIGGCSSDKGGGNAKNKGIDGGPGSPVATTEGTEPTEGANSGPLAVQASTQLDTLRAAGVDPMKDSLEDIVQDRTKRSAVMKSFAESLGVECNGCHTVMKGEKPDFEVKTPEVKTAAAMWTSFVQALRAADGSELYCDSCHQGKKEFLARDDEEVLEGWMRTNYVEGLSRADGQEHTCGTCHGDPFAKRFLPE